MMTEKRVLSEQEAHSLPPGIGSDRPRVLSIQVLRGVAACFVVLYHTNLILGHRSYGTNTQFEWLAEWGWLGVNLFFAISGFTIFLAHHRDIGHPERLARYVWRRVVRIYPIYWALMAAFLFAAMFKAGYRDLDMRLGNLATSITLLPFVQDPELPLKVAWSMLFEVMFYCVFAVAMLNRTGARLLWPLWGVAILASTFGTGRYGLDPLNVYNLYFLLGGLAWWLMPRADRRWLLPMAVLAIGTAVLAAQFSHHRSNSLHDNLSLALIALPTVLILMLCVTWEKAGSRVFSSPVLLLLGDASYSIYLVHSAVLSAAGSAQSHALRWVPGMLYFCLAGLGAVAVGVGIHLIIERPLLARLRNAIHFAPNRAA